MTVRAAAQQCSVVSAFRAGVVHGSTLVSRFSRLLRHAMPLPCCYRSLTAYLQKRDRRPLACWVPRLTKGRVQREVKIDVSQPA